MKLKNVINNISSKNTPPYIFVKCKHFWKNITTKNYIKYKKRSEIKFLLFRYCIFAQIHIKYVELNMGV